MLPAFDLSPYAAQANARIMIVAHAAYGLALGAVAALVERADHRGHTHGHRHPVHQALHAA